MTASRCAAASGTIAAERPLPEAIIVPGVVAVDPGLWFGSGPAQVVRGRLAGYARISEITDWKSTYVFVLREAASRLALPTDVKETDLSAYPRVREQIARSRLVVIDEAEAPRFIEAGEMTIELSYHRVSSGGGIEVCGGSLHRSFSCEDTDLVRLAWGTDEEDEDVFEELWEADPIPRIYDAILRAMTDDEVSLLDVDLALSSTGFAQNPESFEREFKELAARGETQAQAAEVLLSLLDAAEGASVTLPELGLARRVLRPAFTLSLPVGTLSWSGPPLEVPAESHWVVDEVDEFVPAERARRNELFRVKLAADRAQAQARARWIGRALILGLAVLGLAVLGHLLDWFR